MACKGQRREKITERARFTRSVGGGGVPVFPTRASSPVDAVAVAMPPSPQLILWKKWTEFTQDGRQRLA
jgi:hypothetical protein